MNEDWTLDGESQSGPPPAQFGPGDYVRADDGVPIPAAFADDPTYRDPKLREWYHGWSLMTPTAEARQATASLMIPPEATPEEDVTIPEEDNRTQRAAADELVAAVCFWRAKVNENDVMRSVEAACRVNAALAQLDALLPDDAIPQELIDLLVFKLLPYSSIPTDQDAIDVIKAVRAWDNKMRSGKT